MYRAGSRSLERRPAHVGASWWTSAEDAVLPKRTTVGIVSAVIGLVLGFVLGRAV